MKFVVEANHRALDGHFPGRPIVPGVVLLAKIVHALGAEYPNLHCVGVRHVKFKRAVTAGQDVEMCWGEPGENALTVKLRDQQGIVAEVCLVVERA